MRLMGAILSVLIVLAALSTVATAAQDSVPSSPQAGHLSHADVENIVRRSYQYVALYDTLLNWSLNTKSPFCSGGWNRTHCPEGLMDASVLDAIRAAGASMEIHTNISTPT